MSDELSKNKEVVEDRFENCTNPKIGYLREDFCEFLDVGDIEITKENAEQIIAHLSECEDCRETVKFYFFLDDTIRNHGEKIFNSAPVKRKTDAFTEKRALIARYFLDSVDSDFSTTVSTEFIDSIRAFYHDRVHAASTPK